MGVQIREINVDDAELFVSLSKDIDASGFMLYDPDERKTTVEEQKKIIEGILADKKSTILVAEVDKKLIGFLAALGGKVNRNLHSAYLVLGVLEEYQGHGVATKLFTEIFNWAKEIEITRLGLTVIKNNNKAFNLYRKMGFVLEGEKINSLIINGEPVNEYYLYKLIN
ncbi:N-acetyltransferase family protein [Anaerobacillus isosaccharinicus]|uniref:N-acetyltransferase family protein n=1 Tax=Anaerobacillus isosaccharinicus TaxID=1532552 RepID=A0A7S7LCD3_9BACI